MAKASDGLALVCNRPDRSQQVLIISEILRGSTTGDKCPYVIIGIEVTERDGSAKVVSGAFLCDVPRDIGVGWDLVQNRVVKPGFRAGDNYFVTVLWQAIVSIKRVQGFGCVTDWH